ncbi:MAG: quinoprotein glucose dehydrogenase [Pseudohongiellaceae bacterium]
MPIRQGVRIVNKSLFTSTVLLLLSNALNAADAKWDHYGQDQGGSRYSEATEIDSSNVGALDVAWEFHTGQMGEGWAAKDKLSFQTTPILWQRQLYFTTGFNEVFAVNAQTGQQIWKFDPKIPKQRRYAEVASRGVSIWHGIGDSDCSHRLFFGTLDARLIALDATTGKPCLDFGDQGQVDLTQDIGLKDLVDYTITSPPAILGNAIVLGSAIGDNRAVNVERGIVRSFDAITGELNWAWDPVPSSPEDDYYGEWQGQGARNGAANAWSVFSADTDNGIVYVPTGSASPDFYGGERPGNNNYANSLVALNADSGKVIWHFQFVHHDVWDYDTASQPVLFSLMRDGLEIPAVAQATKMGMVFVFNRLTGDPLFPIEERAVPQSPVPGETLSPTQPFSSLPTLADHYPITEEHAWGIIPGDRRECAKKIQQFRSEGIYTPPSLQGSLMWPGYGGGSNWGSVSIIPDQQILVGNVTQMPMVVTLYPREAGLELVRAGIIEDYSEQRGTPYIMERHAFLSPRGIPCINPPWGKIVAIDLQSGKKIWEVPLGTIQDDAPALVPNIKYGMPNTGGNITTASGLIFVAASTDHYLRAFDLENGDELWKGRLPAGGQATPMTYTIDGKQYVVIAAGGHGGLGTKTGDSLLAFAL